MSYNLVKKGESVVLVKKFRDADGKIREHYITSLGVMTDAEFKDFRERCYEHPQENRVAFCMRSGRVKETTEETPRRKAPVGDIREPVIKEEKKPKVVKKKGKKRAKKKIEKKPVWVTRPWLKKGYLKTQEEREEKIVVTAQPTMTAEQIKERIKVIKENIKFSKKVVEHKKKVQIFTKTERESIQRDIDYHQSVVDNGTKAIEILEKRIR